MRTSYDRTTDSLYVELLVSTYKHNENLLDRPLEQVFPRDYIDCYKAIRASHAPPLPWRPRLGPARAEPRGQDPPGIGNQAPRSGRARKAARSVCAILRVTCLSSSATFRVPAETLVPVP